MAKKKAPRKSIEQQIKEQEQKLQTLKMKNQIDSSDHAKEAKVLLKAAEILRGLVDTDEDDELADALTEIVMEMCGIVEEEEE